MFESVFEKFSILSTVSPTVQVLQKLLKIVKNNIISKLKVNKATKR